ncbi:hypothetical protein [Sporosarcina koreensis]|uniref:hypothetical protein n=1 Tax=Sporosarcina koreensis TaxID=334735 RepID=UPI0015CF0230|nr:hypothetical protein [Sporosarcina koreensis]
MVQLCSAADTFGEVSDMSAEKSDTSRQMSDMYDELSDSSRQMSDTAWVSACVS